MKSIELNGKNSLLIQAIVFILMGILLCCSISLGSIINIALGVVLVVIALAMLILNLTKGQTLLSGDGVLACFYMAVGILCLIANLIPVDKVLMMYGMVACSALLIDATILVIKTKAKKVVPWIIFGIAAAGLTFGILLWLIPSIYHWASIVLGAILIVIGIVFIIKFFAKKK